MDNPKPLLLIFDGDCSFCRLWIGYWQQLTGERVIYRPFQEAEADFPDIPHEAFERSVQLILPDGSVISAAHAVFRILAEPSGGSWLLWLYRHVPGFAPVSELAYAQVAVHRDLFYHLTAWLIGRPTPASYKLARWLFIRAIGLIYLFAFASMIPQIRGLIGENGLLPVGNLLDFIYARIGARGIFLLPTVFWIDHSDPALVAAMWIGVAVAALTVIGAGQRLALIVLYGLYLSLFYVGQDFMGFQWDILLLETGFLAIFLAPGGWLPHLPVNEKEPPGAFIWLARWLLFRLMFASGMVKLLSGDPAWRTLTALDYHFFTQPLPTPLAWAAAQLPGWAHTGMTAAMFGIELAVSLLIFFPRRVRFVGGYALLALQAVIALTGNYTFFNLLTMALCIPLYDDMAISRVFPARLRLRLAATWQRTSRPRWKRAALGIATAVIALGSAFQFVNQVARPLAVPNALYGFARTLSHYGLTNTYGLFAVMTTSRMEIVIEGSSDGETWLAYEFPYKPGDVARSPAWVAPYQPRLDWQMWFAALGSYEQNPWFGGLMVRLLHGSPEVLSLFEYNPFPDRPPRYIRARLYEYRFTTVEEMRQTGRWWVRTEAGTYFPEASLGALPQARGMIPQN